MSDTDSFIEEVNDEVRRDKLFAALRKYGWIGVVAVLLLVGGVGYSENNKRIARGQAEALGDGMMNALELNEADARVAALQTVEAGDPAAGAVLAFMTAAQQTDAGDAAGAAETLQTVANTNELPLIYRQIATFKALGVNAANLSLEERANGYSELAQPGNALRLLAEEQLAFIDIEQSNTDSATARLQAILDDSEVTADLQQRVLQVMVALGVEPDLSQVTGPAAAGTGN
ncbi:hypothetical protein [Pseudosulfitobacter sp. SM2401]|uniref:hypothetical protein n=1 Tax=Pseudosulfitobacter sp. SM2401 TaxID=3350098 RepID=UPI0036F3CA44